MKIYKLAIDETNTDTNGADGAVINKRKQKRKSPDKVSHASPVPEVSEDSGKMNYFAAIAKRSEELNDMAQVYLDSLPFISDPDCVGMIWEKANEIFKAANENWAKVPEWVADSMDGYVPFSQSPSNGSLYVTLGHAVTARSANLRMLEYAYGRRSTLDYFPTLAEKEIVEKYSS